MSSFMHDVDAMWDLAEADLVAAGKNFIVMTIAAAVYETPGPGYQWPDTTYDATGRLRGGWTWGGEAPGEVSKMTGGPFDATGDLTIARIRAEVEAKPLQAHSQAWNDVGYAFYVHEGLGNLLHIGPRPFAQKAAAFAGAVSGGELL